MRIPIIGVQCARPYVQYSDCTLIRYELMFQIFGPLGSSSLVDD